MDMNVYALERYVETRLWEARAASARAALVSSLRAERRPALSLHAAFAKIRASRWLARLMAHGHDGDATRVARVSSDRSSRLPLARGKGA